MLLLGVILSLIYITVVITKNKIKLLKSWAIILMMLVGLYSALIDLGVGGQTQNHIIAVREISFCIVFIVLLSTFAVGIVPRLYAFRLPAILGLILNFMAVAGNGWKMPVNKMMAEAMGNFSLDARHSYITASTNFLYLTDRIYSPFVLFGGIASIGDILIFLGIITFAIQLHHLAYKAQYV